MDLGVRVLVLRWGVFESGEIIVEEVVCTASLCELVHGESQAASFTSDDAGVGKAMNWNVHEIAWMVAWVGG